MMTIETFKDLEMQEYRDERNGLSYQLWYVEGVVKGEDFYSITLFDDRFVNKEGYDGEFIGTTPDNGNNVAVMAWEYNAVPVKEGE